MEVSQAPNDPWSGLFPSSPLGKPKNSVTSSSPFLSLNDGHELEIRSAFGDDDGRTPRAPLTLGSVDAADMAMWGETDDAEFKSGDQALQMINEEAVFHRAQAPNDDRFGERNFDPFAAALDWVQKDPRSYFRKMSLPITREEMINVYDKFSSPVSSPRNQKGSPSLSKNRKLQTNNQPIKPQLTKRHSSRESLDIESTSTFSSRNLGPTHHDVHETTDLSIVDSMSAENYTDPVHDTATAHQYQRSELSPDHTRGASNLHRNVLNSDRVNARSVQPLEFTPSKSKLKRSSLKALQNKFPTTPDTGVSNIEVVGASDNLAALFARPGCSAMVILPIRNTGKTTLQLQAELDLASELEQGDLEFAPKTFSISSGQIFPLSITFRPTRRLADRCESQLILKSIRNSTINGVELVPIVTGPEQIPQLVEMDTTSIEFGGLALQEFKEIGFKVFNISQNRVIVQLETCQVERDGSSLSSFARELDKEEELGVHELSQELESKPFTVKSLTGGNFVELGPWESSQHVVCFRPLSVKRFEAVVRVQARVMEEESATPQTQPLSLPISGYGGQSHVILTGKQQVTLGPQDLHELVHDYASTRVTLKNIGCRTAYIRVKRVPGMKISPTSLTIPPGQYSQVQIACRPSALARVGLVTVNLFWHDQALRFSHTQQGSPAIEAARKQLSLIVSWKGPLQCRTRSSLKVQSRCLEIRPSPLDPTSSQTMLRILNPSSQATPFVTKSTNDQIVLHPSSGLIDPNGSLDVCVKVCDARHTLVSQVLLGESFESKNWQAVEVRVHQPLQPEIAPLSFAKSEVVFNRVKVGSSQIELVELDNLSREPVQVCLELLQGKQERGLGGFQIKTRRLEYELQGRSCIKVPITFYANVEKCFKAKLAALDPHGKVLCSVQLEAFPFKFIR